MENKIHSYPKIYNVGHAAILDLFSDPVVIEEKVDGSQFSMARIGADLLCRSKGADIYPDAPEKMFTAAIATAKDLHPRLHESWTYRLEYLAKPKHNVLAYDRIPARNLVLFDIDTGGETYLSPEEKKNIAADLGLECVPCIFSGKLGGFEELKALMDRVSFLGGHKIEGLVIKNYSRFTRDGKAMMGKYVSEEFKEVHNGDWKERNPGGKDIIGQLIETFRTPVRWQKAVQHLRDVGKLEGCPRDIGNLIKEAQADTKEECKAEIMSALFAWAWPQISRGIIAGLPQWYKDELAKQGFKE